jgi:hypothetical protein
MSSFCIHQGCDERSETVITAGGDQPNESRYVVDLRRRFFATGGHAAVRYGVTLEDVERHVACALRARPGLRGDGVGEQMADLVLAVAACDGHRGAWYDLVTEHEGLLCQAARAHLPEIDAVIAVRQLLSDLQPHLERGEVGVSLTRYAGETTLRAWLLGRLVAEIGRRSSGLCERPRVQRQRMPSARRLRLGVRFMHEEGLTAPEAAAMVGVNERSLRRAARNAAWRRAEQSRLEPAGAEW